MYYSTQGKNTKAQFWQILRWKPDKMYINKRINYWLSIPLLIRIHSVFTKLMATQRGTKTALNQKLTSQFRLKNAQYEAIISTTILLLDISSYARSQNVEKQLSSVLCVSLHLFVSPSFCSRWKKSAPTGQIFMKFDIWIFFDGQSRKLNLMFVVPSIILIIQ
jgi:hypothetical protein